MLRTGAAGEYCESVIRQRCGCKICSSEAKSSSGPYPTCSIEDVHSIGKITCTCAKHLVALKMSTVLKGAPVPPAQGISNQRRQQKQTLSLATMPHTHAPPPAINDFNTCYAPQPPANIASPSFGSDVAARYARATLSDAVVHVPTGVTGAELTCCAAAMATKMQPVKSRARLLMRKMLWRLMLHV